MKFLIFLIFSLALSSVLGIKHQSKKMKKKTELPENLSTAFRDIRMNHMNRYIIFKTTSTKAFSLETIGTLSQNLDDVKAALPLNEPR